MTDYSDILSSVQKSAAKRIIYLPHAVRQMSRPDRMILVAEVRNVVKRGELVEDYPEDVRGHSCLLLGYKLDDTPIHVVCSPKGMIWLSSLRIFLTLKSGSAITNEGGDDELHVL